MASRCISAISQAIDLFRAAVNDANDNTRPSDESSPHKVSVRSMERITQILREAYDEGLSEEDLSALIDRACEAENEVLNWSYGGTSSFDGFDFFPLYSGNLVEDISMEASIKSAVNFDAIIKLITGGLDGKKAPDEFAKDIAQGIGLKMRKPHDSAFAPGKQSSPLALWRATPPTVANASADPSTLALREARCEIQSKGTCNPVQMAIGKDIIVVQGVGGYKERDPTLDFYKLGIGRGEWDEHTCDSTVEQGHINIATRLAIDDTRGLVWTADDSRIKSTDYSIDGKEILHGPEHTFDSAGFDGPIVLIDNGARLLRAGRSGFAIWNVDSAPTHATGKGGFVGKKLSRGVYEDTMRDMDDTYIERSRGSPFDTKLDFDEPVKTCGVALWASHPSNPNTSMLCSSGKSDYNVFALDLETGKRTSRYFGHGAYVTGFSTTHADSNVFLTSCNDGGTRLYDVRCAIPSLTLFSGEEKINSSVLFGSGGGLYAFAGGMVSEQIKLWDIRARAALYELSTGNNHVTSLAWDEVNTTLYASTECEALDRMGYRHGYRRAKIGKPSESRPSGEADGDEDMDDEGGKDYEFSDDDDDDAKAWPKDANHDENAFGVAFDAGDHRLFRYVFKTDADVTVLPEYGDAPAGEAENEYGW